MICNSTKRDLEKKSFKYESLNKNLISEEKTIKNRLSKEIAKCNKLLDQNYKNIKNYEIKSTKEKKEASNIDVKGVINRVKFF